MEQEECLDIPETSRAHGVVSFGSDTTVCFGAAPGAGGFVIEPWEAQEYGILPRHCALMWAGGKFRLEFDRRAGVYLNGSRIGAREFCNPFQDGSEVRLKLGFPDSLNGADPLAPEFIIRREDFTARRPSFLDRLAKFRPIRWLLQFIYHRPSLVTLFIVAVAAGLLTFRLVQLDTRITASLPHGAIPADLGQKIAPSVAAVGISCSYPELDRPTFHSLGTAWLYERPAAGAGQPTRWLVTNAHVAKEIANRECPPPPNADDRTKDSGEAPAGMKKVVALFPPINESSSTDAKGLPLEINGFTIHPLHAELESHAFTVSPGGQIQPSLANVYDIAAMQIDADQAIELGDRKYLTLDPAVRVDEDCLKAPTPRFCLKSLPILPGRPLLVFGYPVENQPYLGQGVAAQPFEFRTTVQSRTNALSRTLPGPSTEAMPALYAFSARSSGGMSGGPVVASDGADGFFVVGLVFAGTFVSTKVLTPKDDPQPETDPLADDGSSAEGDRSMSFKQETIRTSISDGAFAADIVSLDLLLGSMLDKSIETFTVPDGQTEMWNYWADRTQSLDQNHKAFGERAQNTPICTFIKARWKLDKTLPSAGGGALRGETANLVPVRYYGKQPVLVTARLVSTSGDEILQLSVVEKMEGQPDSVTTFYGVNSVSYLPSRTIEGEIVVAGPLDKDVEIELWTTESADETCEGPRPS